MAYHRSTSTDTGEQTTKSTRNIVLGGPKLNLARLLLCLVASNIVFSSGFLGNGIGLFLHAINRAPSGERLASLRGRLKGLSGGELLLLGQHPEWVLSRKSRDDRVWEHGDLLLIQGCTLLMRVLKSGDLAIGDAEPKMVGWQG